MGYKLNQKQTTEIEKRNKIEKKGREAYLGHLPAGPAVRPSRLATPVVPLLSPEGQHAWPTRASTRLASSCLPPRVWMPLPSATQPSSPPTLPVPLSSLSSERSPPPLFSSPNAPAAADENHRSYRPPHASPKRQEAPPRPPLPPHQDGRRRKPWMLPASPFPSSATAGRRHQIRPRPASLKLAVHLYRVYVSSPSVSPSLFRRSRAVARLSTKTETPPPPAMPPPSL